MSSPESLFPSPRHLGELDSLSVWNALLGIEVFVSDVFP